MSSTTVTEIGRFFRPLFYEQKSGEKATAENIQNQYNTLKRENKKPSLIQQGSPAVFTGSECI